MLISPFPTPFDHFHFHGSGGLILWYDLRLRSKDVHADIFGYVHRFVCRIYPTHVGYSALLLDNAEVDADIRIRMAIPILDCDLVIIIWDGTKVHFFCFVRALHRLQQRKD